jgi:SecDF, P1 head subdomain
MRSRLWFWVTIGLVVALVTALAATLIVSGSTDDAGTGPDAQPTAPSSGVAGIFELRQVLFQETGGVQLKPRIRPGPAEGGKNATRDLLRVDCNLKARPMQADDNVILCDVNEFRYGLGPSALPDAPVASAQAVAGASDTWAVSVQLDDDATRDFARFTKRLSGFGPPLNQAAIVINGVVVTAPVVSEPLDSGQLQITGPFNQQEAQALADSLGS